MSSSFSAPPILLTTALLFSASTHWKHCLSTWMTTFYWVMDSWPWPLRLCPSARAQILVPGFSGLAPAGAMGSQLFSAPPLLSFSQWPPQYPLSPAAMHLCAPCQIRLPEIPWCGPVALRAACQPRNSRGPCLALCLPPSTNKCNDTQMRNLPLSPPTHSATATKPPHHSPKDPPIY